METFLATYWAFRSAFDGSGANVDLLMALIVCFPYVCIFRVCVICIFTY